MSIETSIQSLIATLDHKQLMVDEIAESLQDNWVCGYARPNGSYIFYEDYSLFGNELSVSVSIHRTIVTVYVDYGKTKYCKSIINTGSKPSKIVKRIEFVILDLITKIAG